jgi:hypothetical protein
VQKSCCLLAGRLLAFHQVTQLILCARIEEIDCVVLDRGMKPGLACECVAAIRERGVTQFLEFVHRGKLGLKALLQISLRIACDFALC